MESGTIIKQCSLIAIELKDNVHECSIAYRLHYTYNVICIYVQYQGINYVIVKIKSFSQILPALLALPLILNHFLMTSQYIGY